MTQGTQIRVRILSYKSFRHYGGREITSTSNICLATFLFSQRDHTNVVELNEDCAGYKKGHKISILPIDFDIK